MAVSTVPAVKSALVALFTAALPTVTVTWAAPQNEEDYVNEMVWLGDTRQEEEFRILGAQKIDEQYVIEVHVQALKEGDDPKATEERAWVMREACVAAVRADLDVSNTLNQWAGPFPTRMEVRPAGPKQWLARAVVEITGRARI